MMKSLLSPVFLVLLAMFVPILEASRFCSWGESCWPNHSDLTLLDIELRGGNGNTTRSLSWSGPPEPYPCAVPTGSPGGQPLYGHASNLSAVYWRGESSRNFSCGNFSSVLTPEICFQSIRNNPQDEGQPAFVVWPMNEAQVQASVRFATRHRLCIAVAGPGHDFLNRHSCDDAPGFMIRISLLKDIKFDLRDRRWPDGGTATFGAGTVFGEAVKAASERDRFVASGWASTVGMVGWSLGGGHGPFTGLTGIGAHCVVAVRLVTATGKVVEASRERNADLWRAVRGGGGSAWGVVTSITVKLFKNPRGGFTVTSIQATDGGSGLGNLESATTAFLKWSADLPESSFSGMTSTISVTPASNSSAGAASSLPSWSLTLTCVYLGGPLDPLYKSVIQSLRVALPKSASFNITSVQQYPTWWKYLYGVLDSITPVPRYLRGTNPPIGLYDYFASVFVGHKALVPAPPPVNGFNNASSLAAVFIYDRLSGCLAGRWPCSGQQMYQVKGAGGGSGKNRVRNNDISLPEGFLSADVLLVSSTYSEVDMVKYHKLGPNSYFSQSAYLLADWQRRYWGPKLYAQLAATKLKWDPQKRFSCHHCVGDNNSVAA